LYRDGLGTTKDLVNAVVWYQYAADEGNPQAMANLGNAYEHGQGVSADEGLALSYYRRAAENGVVGLEEKISSLAFRPPVIAEPLAAPAENEVTDSSASSNMAMSCARDGNPDSTGVGGFACRCMLGDQIRGWWQETSTGGRCRYITDDQLESLQRALEETENVPLDTNPQPGGVRVLGND
ncbi:MAG: sel1 repeat family protein, partial [Gammaproteobacteria bacterium]|nr:sel1 repeat family protein [Gammaproteobacteria bacterium]